MVTFEVFSVSYIQTKQTLNIYHCVLGNISGYRYVLFLEYKNIKIFDLLFFSNIREVELTNPAGMHLYWTFFPWEFYTYKKVWGLNFTIIKTSKL